MTQCQNCHSAFQIFPEDRAFYAKINVPDPTWCPDCRNMRRLAWRNERVLYLRACDLCKKQALSTISADKLYTVYCRACWWSDQWDPMSYGADFDFSRPFFPQFEVLLKKVPAIAVQVSKAENSEYCNEIESVKDSYMAICSFFGERLLYTYWYGWGTDCVDSSFTLHSSFCYETQDLRKSYGSSYVYNSSNLTECKFCFDCRDCTSCFMSSNLRHKSYVIRNRQYTKEDYEREIKKYDFGSHTTAEQLKTEFFGYIKKFPRKYAWIVSSENCSGDYIDQSHNVKDSFDVFKQENGRYLYDAGEAKDSMDSTHAGIDSELMFEGQSLGWVSRVFFSNRAWHGVDMQYTDNCHEGQDLLGCIGLRNKKYCILNKQYAKGDYLVFRDKILAHMRKTGEYGKFFPIEMSFHAYNETVAQQWYPQTRDEVLARGWKWQDKLPGKYDPPTLSWDKVADSIKDADKSITKELFACVKCGKNYRIVGPEFEFYKKWTIPIPRKCPDCRFYDRFAMRNPRKLWHRQCTCLLKTHDHPARCLAEFETPYAPERPETIYCETCYNKEVL